MESGKQIERFFMWNFEVFFSCFWTNIFF